MALIKFLFLVFTDVFILVFGGFVFATMWSWFVVPVFALPGLGVVQAAGLLVVARFPQLGLKFAMMCQQVRAEHKDVDETTFGITKNLVMGLICYPLVLFGAYLVSLFL